jgi:hypothetical protein
MKSAHQKAKKNEWIKKKTSQGIWMNGTEEEVGMMWMPNRKDGAQLLFFASHHTHHDNLDNIPNKLRTLSAPAVDIPPHNTRRWPQRVYGQ